MLGNQSKSARNLCEDDNVSECSAFCCFVCSVQFANPTIVGCGDVYGGKIGNSMRGLVHHKYMTLHRVGVGTGSRTDRSSVRTLRLLVTHSELP